MASSLAVLGGICGLERVVPASLEPAWGSFLAGGCLLVHGATVPDSTADDGVPLLLGLDRGAVVFSPGSSIVEGLVAQGAAVPMGGLGVVFAHGVAVFGLGMLVVGLAHGA